MKELLNKEEMLNKKLWDDSILVDSGVSYYYPCEKLGLNLNTSSVELKKRYRVAMTKKAKGDNEGCSVKLKYKIKTASGEIFSVAAKTQSEAQYIINEIYGKGQYRVSEQLV